MKKTPKLDLFLFTISFLIIFGTVIASVMGYDLSWLGTLAWVGAMFTIAVLASKI
jgi:hypothetical protein